MSGSPARSSDCVRLFAPAKLNLGLRIRGRRPNGYHEIESLFVPLEFGDEIRVQVEEPGRSEDRVVLRLHGEPRFCAEVPDDASNLAHRAASEFLKAAALEARVCIDLHKRIPTGAGLGGGSSDAGAVLRALDQRFPLAFPRGKLAALGLGLGADVPFFLAPQPALVTGIGEFVQPLAELPELVLLLANPGVSLATADVYREYDARAAALTPADPGSTMRSLSELSAETSTLTERLEELLPNHLEAAACRLCPAVARLQEKIRALGALGTGMSGSGATVFGVFAEESGARSALDRAGFEAPVWARVVRSRGSRASDTARSGASPNW